MSSILVAVVCLFAVCLTLQASDNACNHPPMQEVVPYEEHDYIRYVGAPSMYDCAAECQLSMLCLFFTFDPEKGVCKLLKKTDPNLIVGSGIFLSSIQEWKMPLTGACHSVSCGPNSQCTVRRNNKPLCSSYIGMTCTLNENCPVSMTSCFLGRCLCHPGYSHNIGRNSCDRDCKSYGDSMTTYKELSITQHNRRVFDIAEDVEDALMMCMSACVEETSFLCKTIDFRVFPPKCHLSSEGYLDVRPRYRERDQHNWLFAVRKCQ